MIWYDTIWYDNDIIWYDMMSCDIIWYDYDMAWYDIILYDMIWYDHLYNFQRPFIFLLITHHFFWFSLSFL